MAPKPPKRHCRRFWYTLAPSTWLQAQHIIRCWPAPELLILNPMPLGDHEMWRWLTIWTGFWFDKYLTRNLYRFIISTDIKMNIKPRDEIIWRNMSVGFGRICTMTCSKNMVDVVGGRAWFVFFVKHFGDRKLTSSWKDSLELVLFDGSETGLKGKTNYFVLANLNWLAKTNCPNYVVGMAFKSTKTINWESFLR